ncbi:hypothetical protein VTI74DRAFT_10791 [Chaetomium olivicolor]
MARRETAPHFGLTPGRPSTAPASSVLCRPGNVLAASPSGNLDGDLKLGMVGTIATCNEKLSPTSSCASFPCSSGLSNQVSLLASKDPEPRAGRLNPPSQPASKLPPSRHGPTRNRDAPFFVFSLLGRTQPGGRLQDGYMSFR